jgi:hypothetical protein
VIALFQLRSAERVVLLDGGVIHGPTEQVQPRPGVFAAQGRRVSLQVLDPLTELAHRLGVGVDVGSRGTGVEAGQPLPISTVATG